jgi:hypothetical protein
MKQFRTSDEIEPMKTLNILKEVMRRGSYKKNEMKDIVDSVIDKDVHGPQNDLDFKLNYFYSAYNKVHDLNKGMDFSGQLVDDSSSATWEWQKLADFILNSDIKNFRYFLNQSNDNLYTELKHFANNVVSARKWKKKSSNMPISRYSIKVAKLPDMVTKSRAASMSKFSKNKNSKFMSTNEIDSSFE